MMEKKVWVGFDSSSFAVRPSGTLKAKSKPLVSSTSGITQTSASKYVYHVVAPGDTLSSIARKYGVSTIAQLINLNGIHDPNTIVPGMKLKVKVNS